MLIRRPIEKVIEAFINPDITTFVSITNSGFQGTEEEIAEQAISSTEGSSFALARLKALLGYNVNLKLIADRFPGA